MRRRSGIKEKEEEFSRTKGDEAGDKGSWGVGCVQEGGKGGALLTPGRVKLQLKNQRGGKEG